MRYYSSSADFYYDTTASTLNYYITVNGETIYNGKAVKSPSKDAISIDVGKRVRDYIRISMPDFSDYDGVVVPHPEAMLVFNLYDSQSGSILEQYNVRLDDTKEWSGEEGCLSEPINTHADPRQKIFYGHSSSGATSVDIDSYVPDPKIVFDSPFSFGWESGVTTICYTANTDFTLSSYSGGWFSVTQAKADEFTGCLTFTYSENSGAGRDGTMCMEAENGVLCFPVVQQEHITEYYFNLLTPSYQVIGSGSTYYTIEWDTNYESVKYSYNSGATITTTSSSLTLSFPENETDEDITRSVVFYNSGGTILGTAVWKQEHKASEYYFNFLTPDGQYVAASDTEYTITWETNYPSVVYVFNGNRTTTSSSGATLTFPANTSSADTIPYSVSVYTTGNTLLGTLTWEQELDLSQYENEYFTFNVVSGGTLYWYWEQPWSTDWDDEIGKRNISASTDGGVTWRELVPPPEPKTYDSGNTMEVSAGDRIMFKGNNQTYSRINRYSNGIDVEGFMRFSGTTIVDVEGNIMSLVYGDNFTSNTGLTGIYNFGLLLGALYANEENKLVRYAEKLVLPTQNLTEGCYYCMFEGSSNLTTPPYLPARNLGFACYEGMFNRCVSMTKAPRLPATTLAEECYYGMFRGCSSITTAPYLPALTIPSNTASQGNIYPGCYQDMFRGCTSLVNVSRLPATSIGKHAYKMMFYECTSLETAPEMSSGDFGEEAAQLMFYNCTSLKYIKCLSRTNGRYTTMSWVYGVAENGTFVKRAGAYWGRGENAIPIGWNVIEE